MIQPPIAIVSQPHPTGFVTPGYNMNSGYPSLDYLATVDHLLVKQKIELLEIAVGFEGNNKYVILNQDSQPVFTVREDTDCLTRQCCGPLRPFDMNIKDVYGNDVINLQRPLRCQSCCFPCCLQEIEVTSPPGTPVGSIKQNWSCYPSFDIKDETGTTVLKISGPFCVFACCPSEFKLLTMSGEQIGNVSKKWSGFLKEMYTDADTFGINFPVDLDVKIKAVLLGACFLIDFMYFEASGGNNS